MQEVQPPWASELLARNRKVARNICWSTSLDPSSTSSSERTTTSSASSTIELRINRSISHPVGDERIMMINEADLKDVLVLRNRIIARELAADDNNGGKGTLVKAKIHRMARDEGQVVDPLLILQEASSYSRTEKAVTVLDSDEGDGMVKDKSSHGDDGGFEYGPGIVMKLRSKYQSLALRQNMGRPTLRRSASLENCLDQGCDTLIGGTPSPTPRCYVDDDDDDEEEDQVDSGRTHRSGYVNQSTKIQGRNGMKKNNSSSNNNYTRGRSGYSDNNNRDRMRRARSVDALHSRSARQSEEKEILEKFKNVVLPKEEIVIIEVSRPRGPNFGTNDIEERTQLSRSVHNGSGTELNRVRSLTSPEHELPPHDIVRETARIFEKNQDSSNSQTNTNPSSPNNYINNNNNQVVVNGLKKVGHALRLSKTSSSSNSCGGGSGNSSPLPSPTGSTTTTTSGVVHSTTTSGGSSVNGQGGSPYQVQNKGHLSAQGLNPSTTNAASNSNSSSNTQQNNTSVKGSKLLSDSRNTNSNVHSTVNSKSSVASSNNYSGTSNLSAKQVGVIRPTVTTNTNGSSFLNTGPVINGHISKRNPTNKSTASLSATTVKSSIEDAASMNGGSSISSSTAKKPPLGPKPLLTANNIFLKNDKTGPTSPTIMTESSTATSGTNAKSPEPDSDRVRSPTIISSNNVDHGILPKSFPHNKTMEIPLEKETPEPVMEFQQITLKPVAKPKDHSEIISPTTTCSTSKNFTSNKPTTESNKTDKKDPKVNNHSSSINNNATKITATVAKKQQVVQQQPPPPQQPPASVPLRKTPSPPTVLVPAKEVESEEKIIVKPKQQQHKQSQHQPSQLRAHQQQKLEKQKNGGGGETMVFNFTNRQKVPDYIEDDGLHRVKVKISGTVTDESHDDTDGETVETNDEVDAKAYQFEGGNVIINGRSSIQRKPKSQKLNISFNEDHITFEYPSEASILGDDETDFNKENPLGCKTPNILNSGSGLGNYTSKIGNSYQLGSYTDRSNVISSGKRPSSEKEDITNELIEDYLKPDTGSTTWSSEMGADILF